MTEQEIRAKALECVTLMIGNRGIETAELLKFAAVFEAFITAGLETSIIRATELS